MNLRLTYLNAADYVRMYGFSPELGVDGGPRCFIGSVESVVAFTNDVDQAIDRGPLWDVVCDYSSETLKRCGWSDQDAIAALEIAADLATP